MKKIFVITLALGLFILTGCKTTEKRIQPAIKEEIPITSPKMTEPPTGEKAQLPAIIDKSSWHYSIYDPQTKEIQFYDRNNNILWRTFRY